MKRTSPWLLIPRLALIPAASLAILGAAACGDDDDDDAADTGSDEPVVVAASGEGVEGAIEEFKEQLGGDDNGGEPGSQDSGFRQIDWDGVPEEFSSPNGYPSDFFNAAEEPRARGAVFTTPGEGIEVSAAEENSTDTPPRFGHINPQYEEIFTAFSEEKLFSPVGSNVVDMEFFVPGTDEPAVVTGFGAVYLDIDSDHTAFEYFDIDGNSLGEYAAPIADNGISFLGVVFHEAIVHSVRITYGTDALGPDDGGDVDVAVMDNFVYGEPQAVGGQSSREFSGRRVSQVKAED